MKCYVLVGKSASGKDTIYNKVVQKLPLLQQVVTHTSRPRRDGEDDKAYHFISNLDFYNMAKNREFVEFRTYNVVDGVWRYGLAKSELKYNKQHILILDLEGLKRLENYLGVANVTSFYIDAKAQVRLLRSLSREGKMKDSQVDEIVRRYMADNNELSTIDALHSCTYNITNNNEKDLEKAVRFICKKIKEDRG